MTTSAAGENLKSALKKFHVTDRVLATQVVPALDSPLPIVADARKALGENLNLISLEGYMVGKMFLAIIGQVDGAITRENFLKAAHKQVYDIGGVRIDFTNDNQGSDFVLLTYLSGGNYEAITPRQLEAIFRQ